MESFAEKRISPPDIQEIFPPDIKTECSSPHPAHVMDI